MRSLFILLFVVSSTISQAAVSPQERTMLSRLDTVRIIATVERLCGDDFRGRRAGSPEHYAVIDYLESRYAEAGLAPVDGLSTLRQPLEMRYSLIGSAAEIRADLSWGSERRSIPYRMYNGVGGLDITAQVVPSNAPDLGGKIALISGDDFWRETRSARDRGAVACIIRRERCEGLASATPDFPCIVLDKDPTGQTMHLSIPPICDPKRRTYNLLGMVPGSGSEVVIIGAHFDHLGVSPVGIFRGADDNASGTAVMLELARIISQSGVTPERSIVFAAWTGEEGGLIGSRYFIEHPPLDLSRVAYSLTLDMVGVGSPGEFGAAGASQYLDGADLGYTVHTGVRGISDHVPFLRAKIPASLLYAEGEHPNVHSVRDTPDKLSAETLASAARLALLAVWRSANPR
ncbi:MAG: M28 family metallopeptidase [Armatimonadota bacterium]